MIHARDAVDWARRNPESALHGELEWTNRKAADQWRVHQVRQLVALYVVQSGGQREFVSLSVDRKEGGYRVVDDVMRSVNLREIMLRDALDELQRVERKYRIVQGLERVWEEIAAARSDLSPSPGPRRGDDARPSASP